MPANNNSRKMLARTVANFEGRSWANVVNEEEARMTPAEREARNARSARNAANRNAAANRSTRRNNAARPMPSRFANRPPRNTRRNSHRNNRGPAASKPRPGKFMRECHSNPTGCERHQATHNCKFVHSDEPEFAMLRPDQKVAHGGKSRKASRSRKNSRSNRK